MGASILPAAELPGGSGQEEGRVWVATPGTGPVAYKTRHIRWILKRKYIQ